MEILGLLEKLCTASGVSGDEGAVRDIIKAEIAPYVEEMRVDALGSVIARCKGTAVKGPRVLLMAHMDEVGFYIRGAREDGLLAIFAQGIDPRVLCSKRVKVGRKGLPGVIGSKAIHLQSREDFERVIKTNALYIDIGATDKADAERQVPPGETAVFDTAFELFGEGCVKSKALDDRVGCLALIQAVQNASPACELWVAFTAQEETGLRGAIAAAQSVAPDIALVLEGTTAADVPDTAPHQVVCRLGGGVAISFADNASIGHPGLVRLLRGLADGQGIAWQHKRYVSGGNDSGAVQARFGPVATAVLSVPCRYIHSPASVMNLADVAAMCALVRAFAEHDALPSWKEV